MKAILVGFLADDKHFYVAKEFASNMGFDFLTDERAYNEKSAVIWGGDCVESDYTIKFDDQNVILSSKQTNTKKVLRVEGDRQLIGVIKRFILDEESKKYISKTQNQINGKFRKMIRLFSLEGFGKKNRILIENPKSQKIIIGKGRMRQCKITVYGQNNTLIIEDGFNITNMELLIRGNNNYVKIGENFEVNYNTNRGALQLSAKDDNNRIVIGNNIHVRGEAEMVCMEATELVIGDNFGCSNETIIRTGDGHRIFNADGTRTNPAKSIHIGKDCWLARRGVILKGVTLKDYTIIGTGALVTKSFDEGNVILGGNPAKIIKRGVTWLPGR